MTLKTLDNIPRLTEIRVRGKELDEDIVKSVYAADVEMAVSSVTELSVSLDDPGFRILQKGIFDVDTPVAFRGLHLYVAVVETNDGGGLGGLTIRCRPLAVKKLKKLQGPRVLKDVSPAAYVIAECHAAKVDKEPVVQIGKKAKKKKIARDVKESGTTYDPANTPSAWTTMQRLSDEAGYVLYEVGGRIYFGQPTWLVKNQPSVEVMWYPENGKEPAMIPQFRQSIDSDDIEITMELPLARAGSVIPGVGLKITDFPRFSDTYFINEVSYPLVGKGRGNLLISAGVVKNPEPVTGTTLDYSGEWVPDADKRGKNCKYTPRQMVNRAQRWVGKSAYQGHCQAWIDLLAKGRTGGSPNPVHTWNNMPEGTPHGPETDAPAGALVIWKHNSTGHIAISIGNGRMISTTDSTIQELKIAGYISNYAGWMYPNLYI